MGAAVETPHVPDPHAKQKGKGGKSGKKGGGGAGGNGGGGGGTGEKELS